MHFTAKFLQTNERQLVGEFQMSSDLNSWHLEREHTFYATKNKRKHTDRQTERKESAKIWGEKKTDF